MATPSKTCCPQGYSYVNSLGNYLDPLTLVATPIISYTGGTISNLYNECIQQQQGNAFGSIIDPIDCPCCPSGTIYVLYGTTTGTITGTCYDQAGSVGLPGSPFFRPHLISLIPCTPPIMKCCPQGYSYVTPAAPGDAGYFYNYANVLTQAQVTVVGGPSDVCAQTTALNLGTVYYSTQLPGTPPVSSELPTTLTIPCISCTCSTELPIVCPVCQAQAIQPISFVYDPTKKNCTECGTQGPMIGIPEALKFIPLRLLDPIINFIRR